MSVEPVTIIRGEGVGGEGGGVSAGGTPTSKPACANHAGVESAWHCPGCGKLLCEECVRVYATRDGRHGSCVSCGGRCEELLNRFVDDENRAGAVESVEERRGRYARDWVIPPILLVAAAVAFIGTATGGGGVIHGFIGGVTAIVVSTMSLTGMAWLLGRWVDFELEPLPSTVMKLAAMSASVNFVRAYLWWMLAPAASSVSQGPVPMATGLAMLLPTSMAFVLGPVFVIAVLLSILFEMSPFERVVSLAFLLLAEVVAIVVMLAAVYGV